MPAYDRSLPRIGPGRHPLHRCLRRHGAGCPQPVGKSADVPMCRPMALSPRPDRLEDDMDDAPVLICYDGSPGAERAIDAAAALLGARHAVVLDVAPQLTPAESVASISGVPVGSFE